MVYKLFQSILQQIQYFALQMIIRTPFFFTSSEKARDVLTPEILQSLSSNSQTKIQHPKINFILETSPLDKPLFHVHTQVMRHKQTGEEIQVIKKAELINEKSQFTKVQDFLYQPSISQKQIMLMFTKSLKDNNVQLDEKYIECMFPITYLKSFNTKPPQTDMFQIKTREIQPRRMGISILFDTKVVPDKYFEQTPENIKNQKLYEVVKSFYEKRPIFLKNVLLNQLKVNGISCTHYKLKSILAYLTYYYKDGPWKNCHVRFGYDPKSLQQAVIYQVIVIKLKNKQIQDFQENYERPNQGFQIYDPTFTTYDHYKNYSTYQLCDLQENVKEIVRNNLNTQTKECNKAYGWLSKQDYKKIFRLLKSKLK